MVSGEPGDPVVSVLKLAEEVLNISPGAVIHLLQLMVENIALGNILSTNPATRSNVS